MTPSRMNASRVCGLGACGFRLRAAQDTIGIAADPAAHAHTHAVREMSLLALTMARKILPASMRRRSPSPRRQTSVCRAGTRARVNATHCARFADLEPSAGITRWRLGAQ